MMRMKKFLATRLSCAICSVLAIVGTGCIKYADPAPKFEAYGRDSVNITRKVLLISLDGVAGSVLKNVKAVHIDSLLQHSKYTFSQEMDVANTDASGWKSMLTGVSYSAHKVADSTFSPYAGSSGWSEDNTPYYPSFFSYILQAKPDLNTVTITPWSQLSNQLMRESTKQLVTAGDQASKDSAVNTLKNGNPDVLLVDFNGANIAGQQYGYDGAVSSYTDAIKTLDSYVGEIVSAINGRTTYSSEEWLIMLTSDQGGVSTITGKAQSGFEILNYPSFVKEEVKKSGYSNVTLAGNVKATLSDPAGTFDLGPVTRKWTMSMKINVDPGSYTWPAVFSKRGNYWASNPGWAFFLRNDKWEFNVGKTGMSNIETSGGGVVCDGQWHDIAAVVNYDGTNRTVRTFTDGVYSASINITSRGTVTTSADLIAGEVGGDPTPNVRLADIRIFNTALPDNVVANNICLKDITQHPYYSNLISYWSGDDGSGSQFKNSISRAYDLSLQDKYAWLTSTSYPCSVNAPVGAVADYSIVASNVDIVPNLFYWLGISVNGDWGLQGTAWLDYFQQEFVKASL